MQVGSLSGVSSLPLSASWELELLPPQGAVATVLTPQSPYSLLPTTAQRHSSLNSAGGKEEEEEGKKGYNNRDWGERIVCDVPRNSKL